MPQENFGTTKKGNTYDLSWGGDEAPTRNVKGQVQRGGARRPSIPLEKRLEFVEDVLGEGETGEPLKFRELLFKWRDHFVSERTCSKWCMWARELKPIKETKR
jgi:hypothetical protein